MSQSEQFFIQQLNPRVKALIEETGTKLAVEDLEALSNVSVRALTQLFENIAKGINKEKALQEMRVIAVEQLREKKIIKKERQEHWETKSIWLKEQKDKLKEERSTTKMDSRTALREEAKILDAITKQYFGLKNRIIQEALTLEKSHLDKCFELSDMLVEELDDCDDLLNTLKEEEERLKDAEDKREVDRQQKLVDKAEAAYLESVSNVSQIRFELDQSTEILRDYRLRRENAFLNHLNDEEDEDSEAPPDDDDELPPPDDDDELEPPPDDENYSPPPSDDDLDVIDEGEGFTNGADSLAAIIESMQIIDSEEDDPAPPEADDDPENLPEEEPEEVSEEPTPSKTVEDDFEDDFEDKTISPSKSSKKSKRSIPQLRLDVNELPTTEWLKYRFDVVKSDPKKKYLSRKNRTWEIDFFNSLFTNFSRKGKVMKSMQPRQLVLIERNFKHVKRLKMQFFEASHAYDLQFSSNYFRERFYESAVSLRPNQYIWCPNLCAKGESKTKMEIYGSFGFTEKNTIKAIKGACKLNVSSQPFETIQVYCGTWNMKEKKAPADPAEFRNWIIPDKYDLYSICIQESTFVKEKDSFLTYIQSVLGPDYIAIASYSYTKIQMAVFARKQHAIKIANVSADAKPSSVSGRGTIGISLCFNGTYITFYGSHFVEDTISENLVGIRNKMYQEGCSSIHLGHKVLDVASQCQYTFWMGDFGYNVKHQFSTGVELASNSKFDELLAQDQLREEALQGNAFSIFQEGKIKFRPTYKYHKGTDNFNQVKKITPSYPDRILYRAWPGCAIANTEYQSPNLSISDHKPVFASFKINTLRPFASIFSKPSNKCEIKFDEVRLTGNEKSISKATITFYSNWIDSFITAEKNLAKTNAPVWNANVLPALIPSTTHKEFLQTQHIVIVIRDMAVKPGDNNNNIIASGVLHVKQLVDTTPNVIPFKIPAFARGSEVGSLEGYVKLVYFEN